MAVNTGSTRRLRRVRLRWRVHMLFCPFKSNSFLPRSCLTGGYAEKKKAGQWPAISFKIIITEVQPLRIDRPAYFACRPRPSSMRINWLYFAMRSERARDPVLI